MSDRVVQYVPDGVTLVRFLESEAFVRGILGPFGSGKSVACAMEILRRTAYQPPSMDGYRKTRWAVIRNSYPELKTTTLKTWQDWCPPQYGRMTMDSPLKHHVKQPPVGDQPGLDMEVLFLALDRDEDVKKLLSLELTGAWLNEAREIPKSIVDGLTGRVGRYPSVSMGGCVWSGIIMDTNPPDDEHWWYRLAEEETPEGWRFFRQPGGRSPEAENRKNLPANYYKRIVAGKDPDWVKVYVDAEYGAVTDGKAVYPMYRDRIHLAPATIEAVKDFPLLVCADFGLTPAGLVLQKLPDGRWHILDELVTDSCGIIRFAELFRSYVSQNYPDNDVAMGWGDPAGNQKAQTDERTALEIMREYTGWTWKAAPSNEFFTRREVVVNALSRLVDGNPGLLVSPKCRVLRKGFTGGYHFRFVRTGNGVTVHEAPAKNEYSHPHDALQYGLLGGGEYAVALRKHRPQKDPRPRIAKDIDYPLLG